MKFVNALFDTTLRRRDDTPMERLEYNRVRTAIEEQCSKYLKDTEDVYYFEAMSNAIDATLACLESKNFLEKYEFTQISETVFAVRLRELDIL